MPKRNYQVYDYNKSLINPFNMNTYFEKHLRTAAFKI